MWQKIFLKKYYLSKIRSCWLILHNGKFNRLFYQYPLMCRVFSISFGFLLSFCTFVSEAQLLHTPATVEALSVSPDKSFLAFYHSGHIEAVRLPDYSHISNINHAPVQYATFGFHPVANKYLMAAESLPGSIKGYGFEYPEDSLRIWDIGTGLPYRSFPGNSLLAFSAQGDRYALVMNEFNKMEDSLGQAYHYSSGHYLYTRHDGKDTAIFYNGVARGLVIDLPGNVVVSALYMGMEENHTRYALEWRSTLTQRQILRLDDLKEMPSAMVFSPDGKYFAWAGKRFSDSRSVLHVYDVSTGRQTGEFAEMEQLKELDIIRRIRFDKNGKHLVFLLKNTLCWLNFHTGEISSRFWANLSSGAEIRDFDFLAADSIVIGGRKSFQKEGGFVETISLSSMKLYTETDLGGKRALWDPSGLKAGVNLYTGASFSYFIPQRPYFAAEKNNRLELWNFKERRKWLDLSWDADIRSVPERTGNRLLVVEMKHQSSYSGYRIHFLDIAGGSLESRPELVPEYKKDLDARNRELKLYTDVREDDAWWATDGGNKLFHIGREDGKFSTALELADTCLIRNAVFMSGYAVLETDRNGTLTLYRWFYKGAPEVWKTNADGVLLSRSAKEDLLYWDPQGRELFCSTGNAAQRISFIDNGAELVRMQFSPDGNAFLLIWKNGEGLYAETREIPGGKIIQEWKTPDDALFILSVTETLKAGDEYASVFNAGTMQLPWSVSHPRLYGKSSNFDISPKGDRILIKNRVIDLGTGKIQRFPFYQPMALHGFSPAGILSLESNRYASVPVYGWVVFDGETADTLVNKAGFRLKEEQWAPDRVEASPGGNFYLVYGGMLLNRFSATYLVNKKGELLKELKEKNIIRALFSEDDSLLLIVSGDDEEVRSALYGLPGCKPLWSRKGAVFAFAGREGEFFTSDVINVMLSDAEGREAVYYAQDWISEILFLEDKDWIVGGGKSGKVFIWEKARPGSPLHVLEGSSSEIISVKRRSDKLFCLHENGNLLIWDLVSGKKAGIIYLYSADKEIYVSVQSPEGYHWTEKELIPYLHYIQGEEIFPFGGLDLELNRPDLVLEKIGLSPSPLISLFYKSYGKRLARLGLDSLPVWNPDFLPEILVSGPEIPAHVNERNISFDLTLRDSFGLEKVDVWVNGVPLFGEGGLKAQGEKKLLHRLSLRLSAGKNLIRIQARNKLGYSSREKEWTVFCSAPVSRPRIYYIGIGVSEYADGSMNLKYAAKDIRDMAHFFSSKFDSVFVDTLLNESVTGENIKALKQKLWSSGEDDIVVLSLSGHGLLDTSLDFYFAAYGTDFKSPSGEGIPLSLIENLLDSLPARKKLILMDACHSGERDPLPLVGERRRSFPEGIISAEVRGAVEQSYPVNTDNSFMLMKELFADLKNGNGAFIISAAAATEYAYEGGGRSNGVFTYAFLKAMSQLGYDSWKGAQEVDVQALQAYIYKEVQKLTLGKQHPTSRQENASWNWSFPVR
jgi:WD40 repeat protein